ncbi:hypothetical protein [Phenylobacterium sp.]|uniref:hypothetical protein n=1 Tax=Phenylobacterium sp. TaxID=1871053 RepID=UPI0030F42CEA
MQTFTFHLCQADGAASSFEAFALRGDREAVTRSEAMLAQHPTCAYVVVRAGDRILHTERRCADYRPSIAFSRGAPLGTAAGVCDLCEERTAVDHVCSVAFLPPVAND